MLFRLSEKRKWRLSSTLLRILLPSIINFDNYLSFRNFQSRNCASYPRVVWNNKPCPRMVCTAGDNKFVYGVLPEHMDFHIVEIDTQIIHCSTFRTHFLSTYEIRNVLKRSITIFKVMCALRIEENVQNLLWQLARFQWIHVVLTAWRFFSLQSLQSFLEHSSFQSAVTK